MTDRRPVLVLGDANVDLTLHVPTRGPGGRRLVREPALSGGGTAANTATALARLGVPVEFAGAVGDDGFGRWIAADFGMSGIGTRGLRVVEAPTCQVIALIEPDGERSLVVWPPDGGALVALAPGDVDPALIGGAAWLHTTGMCLRHAPVRDTVLAAMAAARAVGVLVSIDLNLRVELWGLDAERRAVLMEAVALADVVLAQGLEELVPLARAVDGDGAEGGDVEAAARVIAGGARTVVARLGAGGALACTADGSILRSPAYPVEAANPIGAGDAFNGGFVAAMVEGRGLADALRWGNAVAALKVANPGGARDLPDRVAVEALLAT
jgi:sugar/nucleoside kinase (ribokinase family)